MSDDMINYINRENNLNHGVLEMYMEGAKKALDTNTNKIVYVKTGPSGLSATDVANTHIEERGYAKHYDGTYMIDFAMNSTYQFSQASIIKYDGLIDNNYTTPTLMSDERKIFWWSNIGMYNSFFEGLSHLLKVVNSFDEKPIVIVNNFCMGPESEWEYHKFMLKSLNDIGVKYEVYNNKNIVYAKNFSVIDSFCTTPDMIQTVKNHFKQYVKDQSIKPFRKVYLSRRHILPREYTWIKDGLSTNADHRLWDHDVLEKFMSQNGFDVIIPEQTFMSFEDQINYMYEVETLVSLSSSGIANALFMQPNTSIIELITTYPMAIGPDSYDKPKSMHGTEAIHHLYQTMAYVNNMCYFGLPNYDRKSETIINIIKNNKHFRKIIMGE
jgi:Glycosyltransferase 61